MTRCAPPAAYVSADVANYTGAVLGSTSLPLDELEREGAAYRVAYLRDAQYVSSRVQHHVHKKTKDGYIPLSNCARKMKKRKGKAQARGATCKQDFPSRFLGSSLHIQGRTRYLTQLANG